MQLDPGDHICALYAGSDELTAIVAPFLADGLRRRERCWFLPANEDAGGVRRALAAQGIDVDAEIRRGALMVAGADAAYVARGNFDPEQTLAVFSEAIEEALNDGFGGFRAAAEMSWVLDVEDGAERVVTYEALLKTLFATARATGLCLYHRERMPLDVIDGAIATHPIVCAAHADYQRNPFYDERVRARRPVDRDAVGVRLARLARR